MENTKQTVRSMVVAQVKNPPVIQPVRDKSLVQRVIRNVVPFGANNLFPNEVAALLRRAKVQRGIINDKVSYFAGAYFTSEDQAFLDWEKTAGRADGQIVSFFEVHKRLQMDKRSGGNAYLHIITDQRKSFLQFQHLDWTKCRVNRENEIVINDDWVYVLNQEGERRIPLFPDFVRNEKMFGDNLFHSVIHFKDYEPEFTWYGIPDWLTGWENMIIDVRTDEWNLSHLDKGVKPDVIMHLPHGTTQGEVDMIKKDAEEFKEGKPGSLLFTFGDNVKSTVLNSKVFDMDWATLTDANLNKALIANSWYKSLMSISQATGFDTERVKYEYQLALRKILQEQEVFMTYYKRVLNAFGFNTDTLQIHNEPILPEESREDKAVKMLPFLSEEQIRSIGDDFFSKYFGNE